jgi:hypothetical protein
VHQESLATVPGRLPRGRRAPRKLGVKDIPRRDRQCRPLRDTRGFRVWCFVFIGQGLGPRRFPLRTTLSLSAVETPTSVARGRETWASGRSVRTHALLQAHMRVVPHHVRSSDPVRTPAMPTEAALACRAYRSRPSAAHGRCPQPHRRCPGHRASSSSGIPFLLQFADEGVIGYLRPAAVVKIDADRARHCRWRAVCARTRDQGAGPRSESCPVRAQAPPRADQSRDAPAPVSRARARLGL